MKTRVLSSLVGLVVLAVVLYFFNTLVLNLTMAVLSLMALFELFRATGHLSHKGLVVLGVFMAVALPVARIPLLRPWIPQIVFALILIFFGMVLFYNRRVPLEKVALAFLFSIYVPLFFSCAVFLREDHGVIRGGFYLIMALGAAWLCDTGAYFAGTLFGKHKLAPRISPKKTVEGSVGGVIVSTAVIQLLALGYRAGMAAMGYGVEIDHLRLTLIFPVLAVAGMMGDLSASVIKRQYGVKDFGNIMPGHGGILDRFDSVLFTLPTAYVLVQKFPVIFLT